MINMYSNVVSYYISAGTYGQIIGYQLLKISRVTTGRGKHCPLINQSFWQEGAALEKLHSTWDGKTMNW